MLPANLAGLARKAPTAGEAALGQAYPFAGSGAGFPSLADQGNGDAADEPGALVVPAGAGLVAAPPVVAQQGGGDGADR